MEDWDELQRGKLAAEIESLNADTSSALAAAKYHGLMGERITRSFLEDDADLDARRVYDFTSDVSYAAVRQAINTLAQWANKSSDPITIRLLTPGGDAIAGLEFYDWLMLLRASGVKLTIVGIGMVFSAGSLILQAAEVREMTPNAWLLIHEIQVKIEGGMSTMLDEAAWAGRLQGQYLDIMADRSILSKNTIKKHWERKNWTLTATEALKNGFIDKITETL